MRLHETTPENYPVTPESIARAKAEAQKDRDALNRALPRGWYVMPDGTVAKVHYMAL